jgi:Protein of unknown function (DUF4232)
MWNVAGAVGVVAAAVLAAGSLAAGSAGAGSAGAGSADTYALTACATRALVVTVATNGAGGTVQIYVGLRNRGRRPCAVRGRASLRLRDARTHALLHVYRNPYTKTVRSSLRRGPNTLFTLQWQNYCGPGRPLLIVAAFGRRRAIERDPYPGARCELPDVQSELILLHPPG